MSRGTYNTPDTRALVAAGMDLETKKDLFEGGLAVASAAVSIVIGALIGRSATPKDPRKGAVIGIAVGACLNALNGLTYQLKDSQDAQARLLKRIADNTEVAR